MLQQSDLDAPAQVHYETMGAAQGGQRDWGDAREFGSLREAVHWAMNNEAPAGTHAVIRASSGFVLEPDLLEEIWSSLQGP